ncbi:glycoside hydrolase family 88/105 protein [Alkalihalobacillus pseudalcaliphilus]|uniref:glycoside hydrolase family 88/105 protein n=1 Tax=Alkalihalobacillus pseudalcaliphilus TaxID=79884 RepID=UPI00064DFE93|nr:glycoside hydrolase family 88 protein [Alkalihalobacillus pseudalcaliphilus]KMK74716.1 glycosyl hydrolase [Alkalihalobacillus pseudalcaliphilus]
MAYELVQRMQQEYKKQEGKWFSNRWHYIEACILKAYLDHFDLKGRKEDYQFVKDYVERLFDENGEITSIKINDYNIDQIRMATILLRLYRVEKDPKYKKVLDDLYQQRSSYPRTKQGSFWHKSNYPNQVWLDGLYMGQPFYLEYMKEFMNKKDYQDLIKQFRHVRTYIYNEEKNLYVHAYDDSKKVFWANKVTGQSPHVWSRAIGWYSMALVDSIELLEGEEALQQELGKLLEELVLDVIPHQDQSGMWYQVMDYPEREGNFLETSGTLMLAYSLLKGVRIGFLQKSFQQFGLAAYEGTVKEYLREENGEILLGGICRSAGLGKHPDTGVMRDGSFNYYVFRERIVDNNGHGVAPLLMVYNEVLQLEKSDILE